MYTGRVVHRGYKVLNKQQANTQLLIDLDVDFKVHNDGLHVKVQDKNGAIDFWPSTGRWIRYTPFIQGERVESMISVMGLTTALNKLKQVH